MKGKKILYIVSIILCLILLAYVAYPALTDGIDSVNTKRLLKGLLTLGALVAGFLKIWGKDSRPGGNRAHYERAFAEKYIVTTNPFRGDMPGTVDKIKWAAEDMEAAIRNRK